MNRHRVQTPSADLVIANTISPALIPALTRTEPPGQSGEMRILGLTGSIGMGKSTAAAMLRSLGLPVHDADAVVHTLLAQGGKAVAAVENTFPGVIKDGAVDRKTLGGKAEIDLPARIDARVEEVVVNVRTHAVRYGLPPDLIEKLWRRLIDWSIAREENRLGPDSLRKG